MAEAQGAGLKLFDKIRQEEDAVKIVHAASLVFLAVGVFLTVMSLWSGFELWMHGLAYIVLGFLLRQFRSRVIATLLVLLVLVMAVVQLRMFSGQAYPAALGIMFAAVLVWVGVRAVEATVKLRGKPKAPVGDA